MKIAIFHNYMDNIGGAEMVGLAMARELGADFYSTNIDEEKVGRMGFGGVRLKSIGKVPVNAPFKQQMALSRFRMLDLKGKYDLYIIDGDWAVSAAVNHRPNIWYVHSPIREIWDLYDYTKDNIVPGYLRGAFSAWAVLNRFLNRRYARHIDGMICNSENTRNRIKMYLGRDAVTIHPPVKTESFCYRHNGSFWLSVNRLITHKRVDMQVEAFSQMPDEKLVIVGCYEASRHFKSYAERIKSMKTKNIEILSWIDFGALAELYATCKGFITTSKDEDFGMAAVEAMSAGKPVIAPNEGGYRETVIDGVTGVLIDEIDSRKLKNAVKGMSKDAACYKQACIESSKRFDESVFMSKLKRQIYEITGREA